MQPFHMDEVELCVPASDASGMTDSLKALE